MNVTFTIRPTGEQITKQMPAVPREGEMVELKARDIDTPSWKVVLVSYWANEEPPEVHVHLDLNDDLDGERH